MKDKLGERMKEFYENQSKTKLLRRSYAVIRIDGKAFHSYTKGFKRPFDDEFISMMDNTAEYLCKNIQNAKCAYVQSDEISILMTDFDKLETSAWFDNDVEKITSISSSLATEYFNFLRYKNVLINLKDLSDIEYVISNIKRANFDARVFNIPYKTEVINYFIWRQKDATRNSISSTARSLYSQKKLDKKSSNKKQEMIFQKGINWNDYPLRYKRGTMIVKRKQIIDNIERNIWVKEDIPIFTKNREYLEQIIPDLQ